MSRERELDELDALARTAFNVYRTSQDGKASNGDAIPDFGDLPDLAISAWLNVAGIATETLQDAEGLPWIRFGELLHDAALQVLQSRGYETPGWDDRDQQTRQAWVIVARHLANVLSMDVDDRLEDHEAKWAGKSKVLSLGLVEVDT